MKRIGKILFLVLCAGFLSQVVSVNAEQADGFVWRWMPVGLQVSTTISDGDFSLSEVVDAAHEAGLSALIVTDRDVMRWEYGLWPLRRLVKKSVATPSISTYGYSNYLRDIEFQSNRYPELIVIPGAEVAPFYYWTGWPFTRSLTINDGHRRILVVGLTEALDMRQLPSVARLPTLTRTWRWMDIFRLFPFGLIALGVFLFIKWECPSSDEEGRGCRRLALRWRITGIVAVLLGIVFISNENPLFPAAYDQYERGAGYAPYQRLADYVRGRGGLAFWSHFEAANVDEREGVRMETAAHPEAVLETTGFTGFSIFTEGDDVVGEPGGQWDRALLEYCRGERDAPVWAVAGMSFDRGTREELNGRMRGARTYVLGDALNWHDLYEAMRLGRMYATVGGREDQIFLREFSLMDSSTGQRAGPGRDVIISGSPIVALTADRENIEEETAEEGQESLRPDEGPKDVNLKVIRNGEVIKDEAHSLPLRFIYVDPQPLTKKSFYRAVITRGPQVIATNPIFVQPLPEESAPK